MPENNSISNIKPCPFCGQTSTVVSSEIIPVLGNDEEVQEAAVYQVCCEACNAEGPVTMTEVTVDVAEAESQNISLWNRRAEQNDDPPTDLKNCPFCGSVPEVLRDPGPEDADDSNESIIVEIFCFDCGATGPANDKDDLMTLWNQRV